MRTEPRIPAGPHLRECPDCGQFQQVPALAPGAVARCLRCRSLLRRVRRDPLGVPLALNATALVLLWIACTEPLMQVSRAGIDRSATLFTGPVGLGKDGLWELSAMVLFTTMAAPLAYLACMTWVLAALRMPRPPRHVATLFGWARRVRQWSMIEVYLIGVFVAYTKLIDLVHIDIGLALYALFALMLVMVAADAMLDPGAVWEAVERRGLSRAAPGAAARAGPAPRGMIGCEVCGLVSRAEAHDARCPRCDARLHRRKPQSLDRTWALLIASAILYVPANLYPVLTVVQLGSGAPSTILGGAKELLDAGMWPLALIVFLASVAVPVLKIAALVLMLLTTRLRLAARLADRTRLYRIVEVIGRWSMIDVFMISILVALVNFGAIVSIYPGIGAVAFCGVVVLTMLAAETFDPRLMWDAALPSGRPGPWADRGAERGAEQPG